MALGAGPWMLPRGMGRAISRIASTPPGTTLGGPRGLRADPAEDRNAGVNDQPTPENLGTSRSDTTQTKAKPIEVEYPQVPIPEGTRWEIQSPDPRQAVSVDPVALQQGLSAEGRARTIESFTAREREQPAYARPDWVYSTNPQDVSARERIAGVQRAGRAESAEEETAALRSRFAPQLAEFEIRQRGAALRKGEAEAAAMEAAPALRARSQAQVVALLEALAESEKAIDAAEHEWNSSNTQRGMDPTRAAEARVQAYNKALMLATILTGIDLSRFSQRQQDISDYLSMAAMSARVPKGKKPEDATVGE